MVTQQRHFNQHFYVTYMYNAEVWQTEHTIVSMQLLLAMFFQYDDMTEQHR